MNKIYAYSCPLYKGYIKVGETTDKDVERRIRQQFPQHPKETYTPYKILLVENAIDKNKEEFCDTDVHYILEDMGRKRDHEWFLCSIEDVKRAIRIVKEYGVQAVRYKEENTPNPKLIESIEKRKEEKPVEEVELPEPLILYSSKRNNSDYVDEDDDLDFFDYDTVYEEGKNEPVEVVDEAEWGDLNFNHFPKHIKENIAESNRETKEAIAFNKINKEQIGRQYYEHLMTAVPKFVDELTEEEKYYLKRDIPLKVTKEEEPQEEPTKVQKPKRTYRPRGIEGWLRPEFWEIVRFQDQPDQPDEFSDIEPFIPVHIAEETGRYYDDLTGAFLGDYEVVKFGGIDSYHRHLWLLRCTKCGIERLVRADNIARGMFKGVCKCNRGYSKINELLE